VGVIDQEEEDVMIRCVERGGILGHLDERIMGHGRPVEQAGHLPACVAGAVARDLHHRRDQLMVPDAAIIGTGDGAQFDAAVLGLQHLHQFGPVRQQPVLHIDAGERSGKLAQVLDGAPTRLQSWPNDQWVGSIGASRPGVIRVRTSGSSRLASTRTARVSTVRVVARSARRRTAS
jgi:hypothetical protein